MAGEDPAYVRWVRDQRCLFHGGKCFGPIDPHHLPRRFGGKRTHDRTCIPLCRLHHDQLQHPRSLKGPCADMTCEQYMRWHEDAALELSLRYGRRDDEPIDPHGVF